MKTEVILHQTHHTLADFAAIFAELKQNFKGDGLHIFPELFLSGYPLQDLVLSRLFSESYLQHQNEIHEWVKNMAPDNKCQALIGGLSYELEASGLPKKIENVIYAAVPGKGLEKIYVKRLLPNYDIFDEQKYFSAGTGNAFFEFQGQCFGLLICEDMWASSFHHLDPCDLMKKEVEDRKLQLAGIINLSASPFNAGKKEKRWKRAQAISLTFGCPFYYVNRVGGEDEILFDGASFVVSGTKLICSLPQFRPDTQVVPVTKNEADYGAAPHFRTENTWEDLFLPQLNVDQKPAILRSWGEGECEEVLEALKFGLQEYATKNGFKKFLVALSGGIDSALVLAIVKLSLKPGQELEAIYMPSIFSSALSTKLCEDMCRKIHVNLRYLPIKFLHSTVKNTFGQTFAEPFEGLTDENVQSRLRGTLLYTRSNQTGAMVINTSNRSELAVGYSTQYGDSVGAISLLGDLYKTEIYTLSHYINKQYGEMIPPQIIDRGPSAELRDNQLDQDSLPPYSRLDAMLEGILSHYAGKSQLMEMGFSEEEVRKVLSLYTRTEYKRAQFCPIIKVKSKSFGFGYRMPMSKHLGFLK